MLFLLSLRFGQIPSGLLQVILPRPRIGMLSLVTVSPVITAFQSCCLSHHVFDQVNLWPAWVGFETAIFWQCSPGTEETQRLYPLRHGPRRAIKNGFFGLINPYLVSQSRVRTDFLYIVYNSQIKSLISKMIPIRTIYIKCSCYSPWNDKWFYYTFCFSIVVQKILTRHSQVT